VANERHAGAKPDLVIPDKPLRSRMAIWAVYIVRCADDTLYTGIAKDVARRVQEHNSNGALAASYTRARRPVVLVYQEAAVSRSEALKREYQIKQMSRNEKERLCGRGMG
jgi:putative endonuclease